MSRIDDMVGWFRRRGNQATLGEILRSGELWSHEMTARMSDARKKGIAFVCQQDRANSSNNLYRMIEQKGQLYL